MVIPQDTDRSPLEYSLVRPVGKSLQMGIEYDHSEGKVHPVVIWRVVNATEDTPAIMLGTSSAWPSSEVDGNALSITAATLIDANTSLTLGASYILDTEEWRSPASLSRRLTETLSASVMYDGENLHPILIMDREGASFSFILLNGEDPAISVSLFP